MNRRRKSVFAESYEPGEENAAVEKVASLFVFFFTKSQTSTILLL